MISGGWLLRVAASTVVRRLVTLALFALLAYAGIGRAEAACYGNNTCDTQQQAWNKALEVAQGVTNVAGTTITQHRVATQGTPVNGYIPQYFYNTLWRNQGAAWSWITATVCPGGATFNHETGQCNPDPAICLAKNDTLSNAIQTTVRATSGHCDSGCAMSLGTDYTESVITANGIEVRAFTGKMRYTGASCTTPTKPPEDQTPVCDPIAGQTVCKRPKDGKLCAKSATTNEFFCWAPSETGTKTSGPDQQSRKPGNDTTPPPSVTLPSGDTLAPVGPPITTTETKPGTTTINSTINNSTTTNGTSPTPTGTPGTDGEGTGTSPGTGTAPGEGGEGNTATGGGDCDNPPGSTGDTLLMNMLFQNWAERCATEAGNELEMTGSVVHCDEPFTVTGGDGGAVAQLIAMRDQNCGDAANYLGDGVGEPDGTVLELNADLLPNGLDESGFNFGGTCPTIPAVTVMGSTIEFNTGPFCDWMHLGGWFVTLLAGLACIRLLTEA